MRDHDNHTIVKIICLMAAAFMTFTAAIAAAVFIGLIF